jgi:transcriptional regulator with XRE-family HTH domain
LAEHFRDIAKRLIGKTEEKPFSYREIEIQTGYTFGYVQKVVTGKVGLPKNSEFYFKMAKALHIEPEDIIEYVEIKAKEEIDKDPKLARALLVDNIRAQTSRMLDLPEDKRREYEAEIEKYFRELHDKD